MSRYDSRTTIFSPEGRLYQVEYAVEAIGNAASAIGIVTQDSVVLATEKRLVNDLLDNETPVDKHISGEKVYKIDDHVAVAVAGLTADANILIEHARLTAQRHYFRYQQPIPGDVLVHNICDIKQGYTQFGGQRPFGVSFLFAVWDEVQGLQLYQTEPSGNYHTWRATAIGQNDGGAQSMLRQDWKEGLSTHEGLLLAIKVLSKTMDASQLGPNKLEFAVLSKTAAGVPPKFRILQPDEITPLVKEADEIRQREEAEKEKARQQK